MSKLQDAIKSGDRVVLLEMLSHPSGLLSHVEPENVDAYTEALRKAAYDKEQVLLHNKLGFEGC